MNISGKSSLRISHQMTAGYHFQLLDHKISERFHCCSFPWKTTCTEFGSFSQRHYPRHIFRAGPKAIFLCPAIKQRRQFKAFFAVQKTASFKSVKFMRRRAQIRNIPAFYIHRQVPDHLYRICMKRNAVFFCHCTNLSHRLDRPYFIVGKHHADQSCIFADMSFNIPWRYPSFIIWAYIYYFVPPLFQSLTGINHGMVLYCTGNDVRRTAMRTTPFKYPVIRLRPA